MLNVPVLAVAGGFISLTLGALVLLWNNYGSIIVQFARDTLVSNPFLQAIFIPSLIGTIIYLVQAVVSYVYSNYISPYLYSYVTIRSSEAEYFDAVLDFVQDQDLLKASHLMACKSPKKRSYKEWLKELLSVEKEVEKVHYRPANTGGVVSLRYKGRTLYVTRTKGETITVGADRRAIQLETLYLSVFGMDPAILQEFIADAMQRVQTVKSEDVDIYTASTGWTEGWEKVDIALYEHGNISTLVFSKSSFTLRFVT